MSEKFQPQVNVKQPDGTFKWMDCTDSTGKPYGRFDTRAEAEKILSYYDDGSAVMGETHRILCHRTFKVEL